MPITFKQYTNGEYPNLKPAKGLAMGWLVEDPASDLEYRYAVLEDGKVLRSQAKWGSDDFDTRQRSWWPVDAVPPGAQWIGHYNPPRKRMVVGQLGA